MILKNCSNVFVTQIDSCFCFLLYLFLPFKLIESFVVNGRNEPIYVYFIVQLQKNKDKQCELNTKNKWLFIWFVLIFSRNYAVGLYSCVSSGIGKFVWRLWVFEPVQMDWNVNNQLQMMIGGNRAGPLEKSVLQTPLQYISISLVLLHP